MSALHGAITGFSEVVAVISQVEEFQLADDEVERLLIASQNVLRHYPIRTTQKAVDFYALGQCAANIVLPRMASIAAKKRLRTQRGGSGSGVLYPDRFRPVPADAPSGGTVNGASADPPAGGNYVEGGPLPATAMRPPDDDTRH